MSNPSLNKSLRLLVHPATLVALGLLLVNDQVMRRFWPSWLSGKLGDFAWLFFAPLALAVLVALLLPARLPRRSRWVALLAFGSVATVFAAAKTLPLAHNLVVAAAEAVLGFSVGWRRDPTDLVGLAGLIASSILWIRTPEPPVQPVSSAKLRREWGWVGLTLAALLTVANTPAPDPGIFCVTAAEGKVYAFTAFTGYESSDGGLTWSKSDRSQFDCNGPWAGREGLEVLQSTGESRQYRYAPGEPIELSEDGGQTWAVTQTPTQLTEAQEAMAQRRLGANAAIRATPMDGVIDPQSGNALFAMGHSGILIHRQDGEWQAASIGNYRPPDTLSLSDRVDLLFGEGLLGLATLLLAFVTLVTVADARRRAWLLFLLAVAWLVWLGIIFFLGPARLSGYGAALGYIAMLALGLLIAIVLIATIMRLAGGLKGVAGRAALIAVAAALLFLLPYLFWSNNTVPSYLLAAGFAAALTIAATLAGSRYVRAGAKQEIRAEG